MEFMYKISGLRSIRSMPFIDLRPVTLLVGLNNSGKSSFLRSLPLLKQSIDTKFDVPILWQGDLVNFGDFSTSINKKSTNKMDEITFHFKIKNVELTKIRHQPIKKLADAFYSTNLRDMMKQISYSICIKETQKDEKVTYTILKSISIEVSDLDFKCDIYFSIDGKSIENIHIDNQDLSQFIRYELMTVPNISLFIDDINFESANWNFDFGHFDLISQFNSILMSGEVTDYNRNIFDMTKVTEKSIIGIAKILRDIAQLDKKKQKQKIEKYFSNKKYEMNFLLNIIKLYIFATVIENISPILNNFLSEMSYLTPVRARIDRYFQTQDFEVLDIDSNGSNLPLFLSSLTKSQFIAFSDWIYGLCGFKLDIEDDIKGHGILNLDFSNEKINVVDTGYGITQILPVLAQIWWAKNRPDIKGPRRRRDNIKMENLVHRTILIEQPELHLHARQQASLANAIASLVKKDPMKEKPIPRYLIETHSEKLIGRFSRLINRKEIKHTDVQVIKFTPTDQLYPIDTRVKVCKFTRNGKLTNWDRGFFNAWEEQ